MPDHNVSSQISFNIDIQATDVSNHDNDSEANSQMAALAREQAEGLYDMHDDGDLDDMIADVKNGESINDATWNRLVNEVEGGRGAQGTKSRYADADGVVHDNWRAGKGTYNGGAEVGPLMLVAPGDLDEMVQATAIDPDEAEALKIIRAVYLKTGSKELAETALRNYYSLNDADQKYVMDNLYSPNAVLTGEWSKMSGDDNDIIHAHIEYADMSASQEESSDNIRWLLCYLPHETFEQLGKSETGVLSQIDSRNIGSNLAGDFLTTEESDQLEALGDLFKNQGTELRNLHGADAENLFNIIGKYAEANFGFSAQYSGEPAGGETATTFLMALGVDAATEKQIVQLQQLVDASSLTAEQKEAVFTYFVSNGQDADNASPNDIQLNEALYAFMNDPVVDSDAKTWIGNTFAVAKPSPGNDPRSALDFRVLSGGDNPPTSNPGAGAIEESVHIGDPMITPSSDTNRNVSSMVYHLVSDTASQTELDDASRFINTTSWDPRPVPDASTIPQAAQIQMSDDNLTNAQQQTVAQIYDIIAGASTVPANQKSSLFSYILTGGKEPPQSAEMDTLVSKLKADASVASTDATLIDNTLNGTPIYQPDNISGANVTDQVWAGFAQNGEGFDNQTYTQVSVTQDNATTAISNLSDLLPLPLTAEAQSRMIDGMVNGTLDATDAALLTRYADALPLQPGDRDVILSAVHKGDAPVPVPVASDVDKYFKDSAIDAAFGNLDFSATGLTSEDILFLKKAAKDGTMTPAQVGLLFIAASQKGLSSEDKMALLNACDYSHRVAKAKHGDAWAREVESDNDDNKDTVTGDPYEAAMSPESCAESGASSDDTQDLGSLYFQVMTDRLQSLDKTVRTYSFTVAQKNKEISTMNNAIAAVPPQPASGADTVPLDSITFLDDDDEPVNLLDYLNANNIKLPTADGSTDLNSTQLSSLRQTMSNKATAWGSDSTMAASNFQNAYAKYNTCLSQISSFLPKWYEMLTKAFTGR